MPEYSKDLVLALLAGSIGLAGLLLVFSGLVLSQAASFPPETPDKMLRRYRIAARLGLIPFLLALADAALCVRWLLHVSPGLFHQSVNGFFVLLLFTAVYGVVLLLFYL